MVLKENSHGAALPLSLSHATLKHLIQKKQLFELLFSNIDITNIIYITNIIANIFLNSTIFFEKEVLQSSLMCFYMYLFFSLNIVSPPFLPSGRKVFCSFC